MSLRSLAVIGLLACSSASWAQIGFENDPERLEAFYGPIVEVSLRDLVSDIAFAGESYANRALRVKGKVVMKTLSSWYLEDAGARIDIVPIRQGMDDARLTNLSGLRIEVIGLFREDLGVIQFWRWFGPLEKASKENAAVVSLEQLVTREGKMDGQVVRVVGKFRGRNLFADLPSRSMRTANDWVIKDSPFAVWVTNHEPKGDGFDLDPSSRRDSSRWVEVIGRPTTKNGVVIIDASQVGLTLPPTQKTDIAPSPPPPERPKIPPVIVFSLPLDGEADFDFSGRIKVQFNNEMDESSFKGRVGLRYEGPVQPGDPGFEAMRLTYEPGSKTLVVDPGAPILRGRILHLVLLTGIVDIDGQPLVRRDGTPPQNDVAEMLRFKE